MRDTFRDIYMKNSWQGDESVSGKGSSLAATTKIREELPKLLNKLRIKTVLDIPCGDYHWWKQMDLPGIKYTGADVVPELIADNQEKYGDLDHNFVVMDLTDEIALGYDLIFCRDLLGHFSEAHLQLALIGLRMSRPKYLLATTFPDSTNNIDIRTGQWRPLNLAYFTGFGPPQLLINEGNERAPKKSLGLWRMR